jgi:gonadotropin-releasing hormone receptor
MLVTAWILAAILSSPQMIVFHVKSHPDYPWYEQCVMYGSFSSRLYEFLYFLMGMIFLYILPLLVIFVTYGGIIIHLHRKSSSLSTYIKKVSHDGTTSKWPPEDLEDEGNEKIFRAFLKSEAAINQVNLILSEDYFSNFFFFSFRNPIDCCLGH